ncbi:MAG: hypothetical protein QJR05_04560 [Thermoanaerobacterium sp.]|nr:hypothetical protein [Thermoanaerobacterium sp.]
MNILKLKEKYNKGQIEGIDVAIVILTAAARGEIDNKDVFTISEFIFGSKIKAHEAIIEASILILAILGGDDYED